MVDPRETPQGAQPPTFVAACVSLRTKTQFYRQADEDQPPGVIADSDTLSYWCAETEDHVGPDLAGCDPRSCQQPRGCYRGARISV